MSSRIEYFEALIGPGIDDPEIFRAVVAASQPSSDKAVVAYVPVEIVSNPGEVGDGTTT